VRGTLFVFLILGAVFFFAGNQVLTVGDLVFFLFLFWFFSWRKRKEKELRDEDDACQHLIDYEPKSAYWKKRLKEEKEEDKKARDAHPEYYKPPTPQDLEEHNAWRISQGYPPLSARQAGVPSVFPDIKAEEPKKPDKP
jgi:hypothetical protein